MVARMHQERKKTNGDKCLRFYREMNLQVRPVLIPQQMFGAMSNPGLQPGIDRPTVDTAETVHISSLALLKVTGRFLMNMNYDEL